MRAWLWSCVLLAGCASGPVGDWLALEVTSETGRSGGSGYLYLDRDGELELALAAAGDGPEGALSGTGVATFSGATATWIAPATWTDGEGARQVLVESSCDADNDAMTCAWDVDGDAWTVRFRREPGLD
jgi:hypothetical protein